MPWRPMVLRGTEVLAWCDDTGAPEVVEGRVAICYQEGGKVYRAHPRNLVLASPHRPTSNLQTGKPKTSRPKTSKPKTSKSKGHASTQSGSAGSSIRVVPGTESNPPTEAPVGRTLAFTDGACSGNPGPAGLGVVLLTSDGCRELSEYLGVATNNIAELRAIGAASEGSDTSLPLDLYTDSSYAIGVLSGQMKAKKNRELITAIREQLSTHPECVFHHVPAHVGVPLNERADTLAVQAAREKQSTGWVERREQV